MADPRHSAEPVTQNIRRIRDHHVARRFLLGAAVVIASLALVAFGALLHRPQSAAVHSNTPAASSPPGIAPSPQAVATAGASAGATAVATAGATAVATTVVNVVVPPAPQPRPMPTVTSSPAPVPSPTPSASPTSSRKCHVNLLGICI